MAKTLELDVKKLAKQNTVTYTLKRSTQWHYRLRISYLLLRLAAWIGWYNVEFEDEKIPIYASSLRPELKETILN